MGLIRVLRERFPWLKLMVSLLLMLLRMLRCGWAAGRLGAERAVEDRGLRTEDRGRALTRAQIMIRPRPGSFVYSDSELEVMLADILAAKNEGAYGVVFGCLTQDGEVDTGACERLVRAARPLEGASD